MQNYASFFRQFHTIPKTKLLQLKTYFKTCGVEAQTSGMTTVGQKHMVYDGGSRNLRLPSLRAPRGAARCGGDLLG